MTLRSCPVPGCPALVAAGSACTAHRASSDTRAYGHAHRRRRAELLAAAIGRPCPLCGQTIGPDAHLDHTEPLAVDSSSTGDRIICRRCNLARGGRLSAELRRT